MPEEQAEKIKIPGNRSSLYTVVTEGRDEKGKGVNPEPEEEAATVAQKAKEDWLEELIPKVKAEHGIDDATVRLCFQAFSKFDHDDSGQMELKELKELFDALGEEMPEDDYMQLVRRYDLDRSGTLDFTEFLAAFCSVPSRKMPMLEHKIGVLLRAQEQVDCAPTQQAGRFNEFEGVPISAVKKFVRKEISEAAACMQLPWALLLFTCFICASSWHERVHILHMQDRSIEYDITENANFAFEGQVPLENGKMGHKNVYDANTYADFWSWLTMGLVPILWVEGWDVSEPRANIMAQCTSAYDAMDGFMSGWTSNVKSILKSGPEPRLRGPCPEQGIPNAEDVMKSVYGSKSPTGMYLMYNRAIGGLRMRQEYRQAEECPGKPEVVAAAYNAPCYPGEYWLKPERRSGLRTDVGLTEAPGHENVWLRTLLPQAEIRHKLYELENKAWLSPGTQKIELTFGTYNGNEDSFTLTYVNFFFTRTGHIYKMIEPVSVWLTPYHGIHCYIADILWLAQTVKIFVTEAIDVVHHIRQLGLVKGFCVYMTPWNAVDWISCMIGGLVTGLWISYLGKVGHLRDILLTAKLDVPGSWENEADIQNFFDAAESTVLFNHEFRTVLAVYPFVVASRFFKAFDAQPRLSMVTKTLQNAFVDIYHFGIVFATVFIIYAVSAMILFGHELLDFSELGRSVNACWRVLLGDFDWETMNDIGRAEASVWFWTFSILVLQIMLNMLLAVIMDVYTEVKGSVGKAETLVSQSKEIYNRWRGARKGTYVPLEKVLFILDPTDLEEEVDEGDDEHLTTSQFCKLIPGLSQSQAKEILLGAYNMVNDNEDVSMSDAILKIQDISKRQHMMQISFEQLIYLTELVFERQKQTLKSMDVGGGSIDKKPPAPALKVHTPHPKPANANPQDSAPPVKVMPVEEFAQDHDKAAAEVMALVNKHFGALEGQQTRLEEKVSVLEKRVQQRLTDLKTLLDRLASVVDRIPQTVRTPPPPRPRMLERRAEARSTNLAQGLCGAPCNANVR